MLCKHLRPDPGFWTKQHTFNCQNWNESTHKCQKTRKPNLIRALCVATFDMFTKDDNKKRRGEPGGSLRTYRSAHTARVVFMSLQFIDFGLTGNRKNLGCIEHGSGTLVSVVLERKFLQDHGCANANAEVKQVLNSETCFACKHSADSPLRDTTCIVVASNAFDETKQTMKAWKTHFPHDLLLRQIQVLIERRRLCPRTTRTKRTSMRCESHEDNTKLVADAWREKTEIVEPIGSTLNQRDFDSLREDASTWNDDPGRTQSGPTRQCRGHQPSLTIVMIVSHEIGAWAEVLKHDEPSRCPTLESLTKSGKQFQESQSLTPGASQFEHFSQSLHGCIPWSQQQLSGPPERTIQAQWTNAPLALQTGMAERICQRVSIFYSRLVVRVWTQNTHGIGVREANLRINMSSWRFISWNTTVHRVFSSAWCERFPFGYESINFTLAWKGGTAKSLCCDTRGTGSLGRCFDCPRTATLSKQNSENWSSIRRTFLRCRAVLHKQTHVCFLCLSLVAPVRGEGTGTNPATQKLGQSQLCVLRCSRGSVVNGQVFLFAEHSVDQHWHDVLILMCQSRTCAGFA